MKEYFEYTDWQVVEDDIDSLTTELQLVNKSLPNFTKNTWTLNDFPYVQDAYRIEEAINNFSNYIVNLPNYVYKVWLSSPTDSSTGTNYKNFAWLDYQNWLNGINQIKDYKEKIEIRYCGEGYSGDTIWL